MAGYPYVSQVQDPNAQKAIREALSQIAALTTRIATLEAQVLRNNAAIACNGQRLSNVGTPTAESDAATVSFVRQLVQAQVETF